METKFIRRSGLPQAEIGAESLALLDAEKGKYFGLEDTSLRIWQLLETPTSVADLCQQLIAEFDVAPDACREEVREFIAQLIKEGLVSAVDAGLCPSEPNLGT